MISRSMAVGVGKGGVGKTTLAINLAAGWSAKHPDETVLLVDCDTQASATNALGLAEVSDDGRNLYEAVLWGEPLEAADGRQGQQFHVVTAGEWTRRLARELGPVIYNNPEEAIERVTAVFAPVDYTVAIFDLPPTGQSPLADTILAAVETLLVPTGIQPGDLSGVPVLTRQLESDPSVITILGVVLTAAPKSSTRALTHAKNTLREHIDSSVHIFPTVIPEARAAVGMAWQHGLCIRELQEWADGLKIADRLKMSYAPPRNVNALNTALEQLTDDVRDRFMSTTQPAS